MALLLPSELPMEEDQELHVASLSYLHLGQKVFALLHTQLFDICLPLVQQRPFTVSTFAVGQHSQFIGVRHIMLMRCLRTKSPQSCSGLLS